MDSLSPQAQMSSRAYMHPKNNRMAMIGIVVLAVVTICLGVYKTFLTPKPVVTGISNEAKEAILKDIAAHSPTNIDPAVKEALLKQVSKDSPVIGTSNTTTTSTSTTPAAPSAAELQKEAILKSLVQNQ